MESDLRLLEISGEEDSLLTPLPDMDTNPDDFASISNFISPMSQFLYSFSLPFLFLSISNINSPALQFLWLSPSSRFPILSFIILRDSLQEPVKEVFRYRRIVLFFSLEVSEASSRLDISSFFVLYEK